MTAGLITSEMAALMTPESVTPGVLYLVSENAPSRVILGAGAGTFAVSYITETSGLFLPEVHRTPETIADSSLPAIKSPRLMSSSRSSTRVTERGA